MSELGYLFHRSRIDYFLMSPVLYNLLESCTIAQGYCRKTFDHKPIFKTLNTAVISQHLDLTLLYADWTVVK